MMHMSPRAVSTHTPVSRRSESWPQPLRRFAQKASMASSSRISPYSLATLRFRMERSSNTVFHRMMSSAMDFWAAVKDFTPRRPAIQAETDRRDVILLASDTPLTCGCAIVKSRERMFAIRLRVMTEPSDAASTTAALIAASSGSQSWPSSV